MMETNIGHDRAIDLQPEGKLTRSIEQQTSRIPSMFWLGLAGAAGLLSLGLKLSGREPKTANFVANWVPTILLLGIYNKLVKEERLLAR
jgi:hypothetical protein